MDDRDRPRLVLMCGLPGSGKTTRARQLAQALPAVRLCPDEWLTQLGINLFDEATRDRLEQQFWRLAQDLLRLGQSVILESGFWTREDRDEKRLGARAIGARVQLCYLDVPIDELNRRLRARYASSGGAHITGEMLEEYATFFRAPDQEEMSLFDG
jgi:predicted kinase